MTRTAEFMTSGEIKKYYNTTKLDVMENVIQVFDYRTNQFHYLVENCHGWNKLPMTSCKDLFSEKKSGK